MIQDKACFCGKPIPASRSRNRKQEKAYCSRRCKDRAGIEARKLGRAIAAKMAPPERAAFLGALEKMGAGSVAVYDKTARAARRHRQEYIDLGSMTPQERLGALCRAAEKMGVLPRMGTKWNSTLKGL